MIAVNLWAMKSTVIPSSARTAVSPRPYTLTASTVRAAIDTAARRGAAAAWGRVGRQGVVRRRRRAWRGRA